MVPGRGQSPRVPSVSTPTTVAGHGVTGHRRGRRTGGWPTTNPPGRHLPGRPTLDSLTQPSPGVPSSSRVRGRTIGRTDLRVSGGAGRGPTPGRVDGVGTGASSSGESRPTSQDGPRHSPVKRRRRPGSSVIPVVVGVGRPSTVHPGLGVTPTHGVSFTVPVTGRGRVTMQVFVSRGRPGLRDRRTDPVPLRVSHKVGGKEPTTHHSTRSADARVCRRARRVGRKLSCPRRYRGDHVGSVSGVVPSRDLS